MSKRRQASSARSERWDGWGSRFEPETEQDLVLRTCRQSSRLVEGICESTVEGRLLGKESIREVYYCTERNMLRAIVRRARERPHRTGQSPEMHHGPAFLGRRVAKECLSKEHRRALSAQRYNWSSVGAKAANQILCT